jgi:hypothetical protein
MNFHFEGSVSGCAEETTAFNNKKKLITLLDKLRFEVACSILSIANGKILNLSFMLI